MIPEIGIMIGAFILARLTPSRWKVTSAGIGSIAFLITLLVIADLGLRGFQERGLASLFETPTEATAPEITAEEVVEEPQQQDPPSVSVTTADGGSITTHLGYGIAVAKGSSLQREWIAIHDSDLPIEFEGTPGVKTVYVSKKYSGEYRYRSDFTVRTRESVRAFEARFLTFDIWGNHVRTLSLERVVDIPPNSKKKFKGEWSLYSENDVERHYASIAYVARVRLEDGRIVEADREPVLVEARKLFAKFSATDLEPQPPRKEEPSTKMQSLEEG